MSIQGYRIRRNMKAATSQFQVSHKVGMAPRTRGAVIAFPSFFLHRVTPIISGTRKALVVWATGPEFR